MIRAARAGDAAAIAAVWNPEIRDTTITFNSVEKTTRVVSDLITRRIRDGHAFLIATSEARLEGFATYSQFRGGSGYARTLEHTVVLAPAARGQGLGRALMAQIEGHARAGGGHSMIASVSSGNPDGIAFHLRLGYSEVAVLPEVGWKFGRWLDLHLMQKIL